jgi:phosphopantothenoylcysteine decarboxylase/phosphopantothenate--cysteine ligase
MIGKNIMVGVTGGIAAFKAAYLVSQLSQKGAHVHVLMTKGATKFITPLTMQALSRNPVSVDIFEENDPSVISHINMADRADLFIIAPATANMIGKLAHGICDDFLSTTLVATKAPIVIAPAMNVNMYHHPRVRENLQTLKREGISMIEPGKGQLACGYTGEGRMAEPDQIIQWVEYFFANNNLLAGKKVLIIAGPTIEKVDPVRFFSNYSSGKMGFSLATAAQKAGAEVTLVSGPVTLETPPNVKEVKVQSAEEMKCVVMDLLPSMDIIIKAAAVADYRPKQISSQKIKKHSTNMTIELERTVDIASEIGKKKTPQQLFIGFAAETENVEEYALLKRKKKGMDLIVANDVAQTGAGFHGDTNIVTIYNQQGKVLSLPKMSKMEVAERIVQLIGESYV